VTLYADAMEPSRMTQTDAQRQPTPGKGKAFFERAEEVAGTGNWDFAIELYLQGIQREPENIERGHQPLREAALNRAAQGGKKPSLADQWKHRPAKDPLQSLVNAEYLLSKEPGSPGYMEQVIKAARALDCRPVVRWACDLLLRVQKEAKKPSRRVLELLASAYDDIEAYGPAIQACQMALQMSPDDAKIRETITELSAKHTLQQGKYGQEGDFVKGVKDMERQQRLIQKDAAVKSREFLESEIAEAKQDYLTSPTVMGKINAYVDALLKIEEEAFENEAIDVLTKAHRDTGAYQYKMRIGDIRIRQMTRRFRALKADGDEQAAAAQARRQLEFELEEYTERALNYPTDLDIKYELGRRQLLAGQIDEAIASLQQAQRSPKRHLRALGLLGQAFATKGWFHEAAETYERALSTGVGEERAKQFRYSLGDVFEKMGEHQKAMDQFSDVAQLDYNYKDVAQRVEALRRRLEPGGREGSAETASDEEAGSQG
jgi:tetratricopeptide (TPR) repeat protein